MEYFHVVAAAFVHGEAKKRYLQEHTEQIDNEVNDKDDPKPY